MSETSEAAKILGRLGGKSKSPAKQAASRRNGAKANRKTLEKIAEALTLESTFIKRTPTVLIAAPKPEAE
jgi:hypothetical protein